MFRFEEDLNKYLDEIKENLKIRNQQIKRLQKENELLKEEAYKDKELSELKEKYDKLQNDYKRGFQISKDEEQTINNWKKEHFHGECGAAGGQFSYEFIPTSLGEIGIIKCSCGDEFIFKEIE